MFGMGRGAGREEVGRLEDLGSSKGLPNQAWLEQNEGLLRVAPFSFFPYAFSS